MKIKNKSEKFIYSSCLINNETLINTWIDLHQEDELPEVEKMIVAISKGQQITIPAEIRNEFDLDVGSKLEIVAEKDKIVIKPIGEDLEAVFKETEKIKPKRKLTAEQMDELNEALLR